MIVITDGQSNGGEDVATVSKDIHAMGVEVIAIGIGKTVNTEELKTIASNDAYVFEQLSFDQLEDIQTMVADLVCKKQKHN